MNEETKRIIKEFKKRMPIRLVPRKEVTPEEMDVVLQQFSNEETKLVPADSFSYIPSCLLEQKGYLQEIVGSIENEFCSTYVFKITPTGLNKLRLLKLQTKEK